MKDIEAARALGWASLAIAAAEAFAHRGVSHDMLGIKDHPMLMKALAAREAAAGVTLLSQTEVTPTVAAGLWSRVAGDAMDLALLGLAAATTRRPSSLAATTATVLAITAADVYYALRVTKRLSSGDPEPAPARTYPPSAARQASAVPSGARSTALA